jgi:uncharacterized protein (DUF1499 family)
MTFRDRDNHHVAGRASEFAQHATSERASTPRPALPKGREPRALNDFSVAPDESRGGIYERWISSVGLVAGMVVAIASVFIGVDGAAAFSNAAPEATQFQRQKKTPGTMPEGLGMQKRVTLENDLGLKPCGKGQNCFSSTPSTVEIEDDTHYLPPWSPPAQQGASPTAIAEAGIAQIKSVIERYPPGQAGIDGGGFQIVQSEPGYLYVQFESLKNGYIDDVEFGTDGAQVVIRSASRKGFIDQGVNCKRLNWISAELRALGWDAPMITEASHYLYYFQNFEFLNMQQQLAQVTKTTEQSFDNFLGHAMPSQPTSAPF